MSDNTTNNPVHARFTPPPPLTTSAITSTAAPVEHPASPLSPGCESVTSSTAPTVIVNPVEGNVGRGSGDYICHPSSPSWGHSPGSFSDGAPSPMSSHRRGLPDELCNTTRLSGRPATATGTAMAGQETVVLYTLVPEAEVKNTTLVTPPSPGLLDESAVIVIDAPPRRIASPLSALLRPPPPPPPPQSSPQQQQTQPETRSNNNSSHTSHVAPRKADDIDTPQTESLCPLIDREASTLARLADASQSMTAPHTHTHTHVPLLGVLPLDADKSTYESLCATGVAPLFRRDTHTAAATTTPKRARAPPTTTVAPCDDDSCDDTRPKKERRVDHRDDHVNTSATDAETLTAHNGPRGAAASAWVTREQRREDAQGTCMSAEDVDARLDLLEEVELAQLAVFLPRTFPLHRLVAQVVPSTAWLRTEKPKENENEQEEGEEQGGMKNTTTAQQPMSTTDDSDDRPLDVHDTQAFLRTLQRTHREHVLRCLDDETSSTAARLLRDIEPPHDDHYHHHTTTTTHNSGRQVSTPTQTVHGADAETSDASPTSLDLTFAECVARAEASVRASRAAQRAAQRQTWHDVTRRGRGCLVEWQDGTVGDTTDLDGLFREEHVRQERFFHPLPTPFPCDNISGGDDDGCDDGAAEAFCLPRPPHSLREAALGQCHRLHAFEQTKSAFVHARVADGSGENCGSGGGGDARAVQADHHHFPDCPLCVDWQPMFAQVQPPPAGLEVYLEHLHGSATVPESVALAAARTAACVPLKQPLYAAYRTAMGRCRGPDTLAHKSVNHDDGDDVDEQDDDEVMNRTADAARRTQTMPIPPGLRRDLQLASSHMQSHKVSPTDVFASLATVHATTATTTTAAADDDSERSGPKRRERRQSGRGAGGVRTATSSPHGWLDDAVLEEVVLVGLAPRGQPYALELVPPSLAFRRLLLLNVTTHARLYTTTVLPVVAATMRSGCHADDIVVGALSSMYKRALARALEVALLAPHCAANGDLEWLRAHVVPLLLNATTTQGDEEPANGHSSGAMHDTTEHTARETLEAIAAAHATSLIAMAADDVVAVVLAALRTVLYRRTFTMYELLRLLATKALFVANRQLITRYREWYTQTPSPAAILCLLQRSSRFGFALARAFPQLMRHGASPQSRQPAVKADTKQEEQEQDEDEDEEKDEPEEEQAVAAGGDAPCVKTTSVAIKEEHNEDTSGTVTPPPPHHHHHRVSQQEEEDEERPGHAHDQMGSGGDAPARFRLNFVPEAALLEPSYVIRFSLWVLETHHGQLAQATEMSQILLQELAALSETTTHAGTAPKDQRKKEEKKHVRGSESSESPSPQRHGDGESDTSASTEAPGRTPGKHAAAAVASDSTSSRSSSAQKTAAHAASPAARSTADRDPRRRDADKQHASDDDDDDAKDLSRTAATYASASYPFLVPYCPGSVDPALTLVLMAVGLRGRTFLAEEVDRYINALVSRGDR